MPIRCFQHSLVNRIYNFYTTAMMFKLRCLEITLFVAIIISFESSFFSQSAVLPDVYSQITAAYQQRRLGDAEKQLRALLQSHPAEVRALSLMGVVLDALKRYDEAETYYFKAQKLAPNSPLLENNLGNHYLAQGKVDKARQAFLRAVALDPRHPNAHLQLVKIQIQKKEYAAALRHLDQMSQTGPETPSLQLLRAQALFGAGQIDQAHSLLNQLESQSSGDLQLAFLIGIAYVEMERFSDAEKSFSHVLQADPTNFEVLYNLGTAALRAGHWDRARQIYQSALLQKPHDADCLMGLARSLADAGKDEQALPILFEAHREAPARPDILLLTAQTSSKLGFPSDATVAYDKYLRLKPEDDIARRERGVALVMSQKLQEGIRELEWFVQKHPQDAWGHYQLASALSLEKKEQALAQVDLALHLDPQLKVARFARGVMYLELRRPKDAIVDLKAFLDQDPGNIKAQDQLGRAYLQNDQPVQAAGILKKVIDQSPKNPALYFQYSRALRALGRTQELNEVLEKIAQLGGLGGEVLSPAGQLDYFTLSPAERQARKLGNLQKAIQRSPEDPEPKLLLAGLYLDQRKVKEALLLMEQIQKLSPDLGILSRCGRLLVDYGLYSNALPFLENAVQKGPATEEILLDRALAVFHVVGGENGLRALDAIPPPQRSGNYYLLRAQILDQLDRFSEAVDALNQALRAAPTREDLYSQACAFLIKHKRYSESLKLLDQSGKQLPDAPNLMVIRSIVLELMGQSFEAAQQLAKIQSQWPEWYSPYLIQGIILESQHQAAEARQSLETAILLNPGEPSAYYHLALALKDLAPRDNETAYKIISQGLKLDPHDPYMQTQAGRISLDRGDYPKALGHLQEAIRLLPEMADAHWLLANLYRMTGEKEKQREELAEVNRLNKLYPPEKQLPMPIQDLLFTVHKPGEVSSRTLQNYE